MSEPAAKTIKPVATSIPLPEILTKAGQLAAGYVFPAPDRTPQPAIIRGAKIPKSRIRAAHELAILGVRFVEKDQPLQAIERLRRSIELNPTVATVHHDLGVTYLRMARFDEAVGALRLAIDLNPQLVSAYLSLGTALDFLGREREAQLAYEAGAKLDPTQPRIHARLGQILLAGGHREQAEAAFHAAAAAEPARARIYTAQAAMIAGRAPEAEILLRALIADVPESGEAYIALGQILAENGRSAEAAASFERGLLLDPQMVAAWSNLATNKKFTAQDRTLIDHMNAALKRHDLTPMQRQSVHFALGKAYDDIGDYAAAMRHIEDANRIRGAHRQLDRAKLAQQTDHVIASTPPGFVDRRPDLGVEDATPILIVGMPRSGTTLVEQILSSHAMVAAGGELAFWRERNWAGLGTFDADVKAETVLRLAGDYLGVLRTISRDAARVTDKTPFNLAHLGIIRQVFPHATFVHCRRHPIDTCLSIFATDFQTPYDFVADRGSLVFFYREYRRLMSHWRQVLPRDHFIEVDYETSGCRPRADDAPAHLGLRP